MSAIAGTELPRLIAELITSAAEAVEFFTSTVRPVCWNTVSGVTIGLAGELTDY